MKKLVMTFPNGDARSHFVHWLCGQGEQDYWMWMEYREQEEPNVDITVFFDYRKDNAYDPAPDSVMIECLFETKR